ncbi:Cys-tRNA(Pro) deacylase [Corynebacterium ureicelerivorans]|uniref:Cys-tRNA(Pro)/Cys-tRNA(Cys) deacylase n=1 Tax=Corynebacterium ureicelerivorans TaxID=401472 RepID=A0A077HH41_9CORY|nr:Cys-tRNA(Pro) deacylase [Corynebacterium ureicelerivorans]AIL96328.1 transcriptional regulator [Corynebacterium ureicelerivorans]MDN8626915.1 Cys-tRNA(Pro) deacylase [Corynebacterium ureicelerivorans]
MAEKTRALTALHATDHEVLTYAPSQDHFGTHAAEELDLDPAAVLKTLVIAHERDLAICCVPVDGHLSLKAAAKALGWKRAEMAEPAKAQRATGYVVGGISPLGTLHTLPTLIDASVADLPTVTVSAGQRGLSARLSPQDLAELTGAQFAAISAP